MFIAFAFVVYSIMTCSAVPFVSALPVVLVAYVKGLALDLVIMAIGQLSVRYIK